MAVSPPVQAGIVPAALPARSDPKGVNVVCSNEASGVSAKLRRIGPMSAAMLVPAISPNVRLFILVVLPLIKLK
jgi:hypothetical protein